MSKYEQHEIGVRATTDDGFYGFIIRSSGKEQLYLSARYDDFDLAMKDSWKKWQEIKNKTKAP